MIRTSDLEFGRSRDTKIFVAPGEHSFSLFQEENTPWNMCVLLTSPLINIISIYQTSE